MSSILVRGLDQKTIERLKERARLNGRSLQQEVKALLERAAGTLTMHEAGRVSEQWRHRLGGRSFSDSTQLIPRIMIPRIATRDEPVYTRKPGRVAAAPLFLVIDEAGPRLSRPHWIPGPPDHAPNRAAPPRSSGPHLVGRRSSSWNDDGPAHWRRRRVGVAGGTDPGRST